MADIITVNATTAPPAIPLNHKFSLIVFDDCIEVKLSTDAVLLSPTLTAYKAAPFELPDHWKAWIGSLETEHFKEANLAIMIHRLSATPEVMDQDTKDLERELTAFVFGMMIQGVPDFSHTVWVSGANVNGDLSVRGNRHLKEFVRSHGQTRPFINDAWLSQAVGFGEEILKMFQLTEHRRVRVGFNKLISGLNSALLQVRLHDFVRSVDGLMALEKGKSTWQFQQRARTFAALSGTTKTCRMFYELRSAEEHLNDWTPLLDPSGKLKRIELDALGLAWADAAQRLATDVYRRLLRSPALLAEFKDEASTNAFWALDDKERLRRWGPPLKLEIDPSPFQKALSYL
jgi:hypothetical protein